ncbi:MAG: C13 family peptidase [Gammaproteobacteria bacterium]
MNPLFADAIVNLRSGWRVAFFRPCHMARFRFSEDQLVILLFYSALLETAFEFLLALPVPQFNPFALAAHAFGLGCFFLAAYLTGKLFGRNGLILEIGIVVYSFVPLLIVFRFVSTYLHNRFPEETFWLPYLFPAYVLALFSRSLYLIGGQWTVRTVLALALMSAALGTDQMWYGNYRQFWFAAEESGPDDPYAEYRSLDAEALMYRQPEILDQALARLLSQRKGVTDVFFVGFAGFAAEDVFSKEVGYIRDMLDRRFGTLGHSINLINHLRTHETTPLATSTNLAMALKRIGSLMDPEEDVLLLYLTSHGAWHELSVSFWPLALNSITPESLNAMLDAAGIKWRIIVISACYSGGFIKHLQGPSTLMATAAAEDKTSFGCGTQSEFTYFGEAVFKEQLNRHHSFITAFRQAIDSIGRRERRENLEPSSPQLSIGAAIEAKLRDLPGTLTTAQ